MSQVAVTNQRLNRRTEIFPDKCAVSFCRRSSSVRFVGMSSSPRRPRRFKPGTFGRRLKGTPATGEQLRNIFNGDKILERSEKGELTVKLLQKGHPSPPRAA